MNDTAKGFTSQTDDFRMESRGIVDFWGGEVAGYYDDALQVALPANREDCTSMARALEKIGMVGGDSITWFPLGSDNPPESLRHFGNGSAACPRGDRPSYWKYRSFYVV